MTKLVELATVLRTKNAGPFQITVDLFFADRPTYDRVVDSAAATVAAIAAIYAIDMSTVAVYPMPDVLAIKVTYDRPTGSSGSPEDRDVYGAQQHGPLLAVDIP